MNYEMTEEKPWWFPVLADDVWIARIREDYPEHTANMDDDDVRNEYSEGRKYATLWDHVGDAYDDYENVTD